MHPAKSVILFTTASGAGYGLVIVAVLLDLMGGLPRALPETAAVIGLALVLIVTGLLASTFHLGHPERAWRALSQWRSSWLSREGVAALWAFLPIVAWAGVRVWLPEAGPLEQALGVLAAVSALVVLYCTGMIYASLKAVPDWATRWTPAAYLLIGPATGALLLNAIAQIMGFAQQTIGQVVPVLLLAALVSKLGYWKRAEKRAKAATSASATGLAEDGKSDVTLLEPPHSESNYLMQEMGFRITRKHAGRLRRIAVVWTFIFPMLAVWFAGYGGGWWTLMLTAISLVTAGVGVVAERYLFFAEAKHVQSLYYGETEV